MHVASSLLQRNKAIRELYKIDGDLDAAENSAEDSGNKILLAKISELESRLNAKIQIVNVFVLY